LTGTTTDGVFQHQKYLHPSEFVFFSCRIQLVTIIMESHYLSNDLLQQLKAGGPIFGSLNISSSEKKVPIFRAILKTAINIDHLISLQEHVFTKSGAVSIALE